MLKEAKVKRVKNKVFGNFPAWVADCHKLRLWQNHQLEQQLIVGSVLVGINYGQIICKDIYDISFIYSLKQHTDKEYESVILY